jgi:uncharacterized protein (DUF58 family)
MNMERLEISKKDIQPAELTPGTEKNLKLFLFCLILFFAFTTLYVIPLSYTSLGFWAVICVAVLLGFAVLGAQIEPELRKPRMREETIIVTSETFEVRLNGNSHWLKNRHDIMSFEVIARGGVAEQVYERIGGHFSPIPQSELVIYTVNDSWSFPFVLISVNDLVPLKNVLNRENAFGHER